MNLIEKVDFTKSELNKEYYQCTFSHCDFSNRIISEVCFESCTFEYCNFSLTRFANNLQQVSFSECKMTGANFTAIGRLSNTLSFSKTQLNYANFSGLKLRNIVFRECNIWEAFFEEADISLSVFERCDLSGTSFFHTNLEGVDFSTAYNFTINPNVNRLKKAIFSAQELRGLLSYLNIVIKDF